MSKHDRKSTRKLMKRMIESAKKGSKTKKALTPEVLEARFAHIMDNASDTNAINQYASAAYKAISNANEQVQARITNILEKQIDQLCALLRTRGRIDSYRDYSKLKGKLKKIKLGQKFYDECR